MALRPKGKAMLVTIFDTETTDLIENSARRIEKQPRIIELFALTIQQTGSGPDVIFKEVDTWESLFNPGVIIPEINVKITGISNDMVVGKPRFPELADEVMSYITRAHRVVAHNVSYDRDVVDFELKRCEKSFRWPSLMCTVEQTDFKSPLFPGHRLSLTKLHEILFGVPFEGAHRAEPDVRATAKCYMELVRREII